MGDSEFVFDEKINKQLPLHSIIEKICSNPNKNQVYIDSRYFNYFMKMNYSNTLIHEQLVRVLTEILCMF